MALRARGGKACQSAAPSSPPSAHPLTTTVRHRRPLIQCSNAHRQHLAPAAAARPAPRPRPRRADVINVRPTRVLLVTDRHVAYLRARHLRRHSIYKAKWLVPIAEMQNLTGEVMATGAGAGQGLAGGWAGAGGEILQGAKLLAGGCSEMPVLGMGACV